MKLQIIALSAVLCTFLVFPVSAQQTRTLSVGEFSALVESGEIVAAPEDESLEITLPDGAVVTLEAGASTVFGGSPTEPSINVTSGRVVVNAAGPVSLISGVATVRLTQGASVAMTAATADTEANVEGLVIPVEASVTLNGSPIGEGSQWSINPQGDITPFLPPAPPESFTPPATIIVSPPEEAPPSVITPN